MNRNSKLLRFFREKPRISRTIANLCILCMVATSIAIRMNWIPAGWLYELEVLLFVSCGLYTVLWFEYGGHKK